MRKKIVAGNWKMNKNYQEGMELVAEAMHMINDELNAKVLTIFASPAIHLASVQKLINGHANFASAAQNCHQENAGAFTGEIAASMIHSVGASYVLIGHSERRQYFKETNELLAKKVDAALANHLHPIFCFGELKEEREAGKHFEVVAQQLKESLFHLTASDFAKIVLAYEPVWAIGTGLTASPEQAQEMHAFIRASIANQFGADAAEDCSILYGGSCNPQNAKILFSQADIDGGLIGGASLKSRDFTDIVTSFNSI